MGYRPSDWSPLAGADPVPGDPEEVTAMARHYRDTAAEISRLVGRLERVAADQDGEGEALRTLTEAAGDLAEELGKAYTRYDQLAQAVAGWAEPLRTAQSASLSALREAQAAEREAASSAGSLLTGVTEPTQVQKDAQDQREAAHDAAGDRMAEARRRLEHAVSALDDAAERTADDIRDAANHHADSRWERFKGWVQDNAGIIKLIAEIAAWVATALAVVALFITSPVWAPIVAAAAVVLGLVALIGHSMLASAGEGSWGDVAMDVFALATFGVGRVAIRGVRSAVAGTKTAASVVARANASRAVLAQHRFPLRVADWAMRTRLPLGPLRGTASRFTTRITGLATRAGDDAAGAILNAPVPQVSVWQAARRWDRELAQHLAQLDKLKRLAPVEAAAAAARTQRLARLFVGGAVIDGVDKGATVVEGATGTRLKPDIHYEIPPLDLPPFVLPGPRPFVLASGRP